MSLKPKTSKRLLILAGILVAAAGGIGGLVVVRQMQQRHAITTARADGMRLFQEHNYFDAMGSLSRYLGKHETDREAILAYAKCREMIEEPKGEHILQAISHYRRAYALDRTDTATAMHLLELMPLAGLNVETRDLAVSLRPAALEQCTTEHVKIVRAEASARLAANPNDPLGEALLRRLIELDANDLPARVLLVEHLRDRKRVPDALSVASSVPSVSPAEGTARRRLLTALARRDEPAFDANGEVFAALCDITGLDPSTAGPARPVQFASSLEVLRTATLFDGLGAYAHGLAVLLEGHRQLNDEVIERLVARRTWMAGRPNDTIALASSVDLAPTGTHSDIAIFLALAHLDAGNRAEALAIAKALGDRKGDYRAAAWKPVLEVRASESRMAPDAALSLYTNALQIADDDPALLLFQGDAYEQLGKTEDARKAWERASRSSLAAGWTQPALRRTYLALSQNQPSAALKAAQEAFRIAPRSMSSFAALFRSHIASLESGSGDGTDPVQLLSMADRIDAELALSQNAGDVRAFRNVILPGRVILSARAKTKDAARSLLAEALSESGRLDADTLVALAEVDRAYQLGEQGTLLERLVAAEKGTPRVEMMRALHAFDGGDAQGGLTLLTQGAAQAPEDVRVQWARARATFLDRTQDPQAAGAWVELARANPTDVSVHLAALASPAVRKDAEAVRVLLERLGTISNFTLETAPPQLRLVRAGSLLAEPVTSANRRTAIDILRSLVVQEPDMLEARITLVLALIMDKPEQGIAPMRTEAIQHVRAIVPLAPDADPWSLELGKLYRGEGDVQAARAEFERLANNAGSIDVRLAAAEQLLDIRAFESAAAALEKGVSTLRGTPKALCQSLLARAQLGLGRATEAQATLRGVVVSDLATSAHVLQLADVTALAGDVGGGRRVLEQLARVEQNPVEQLLTRARFESRHGTDDDTVKFLREAAATKPASTPAYLALAAHLIEHNRSDEAKDVLAQATLALPGDARVATMVRQLDAMAAMPADAQDLVALANLLEQSPQTKTRAQLVRSIEQARAANQLRVAAQVAALRDSMKDDPVVLSLLARTLLRTSPPNLASAADVASTALRLHPSSPEAAGISVEVARLRGDWQVMLEAGETLRQLTRDPGATASVAEAQLNMRRFDDAIATLTPLVSAALETPQEPMHARVLGLLGGAHVLAGRPAIAFSTLSPVLARSASLRNDFWLPAAGSTVASEREARAWIEAGVKAARREDEGDQVAIASAYASAARRFPTAAQELVGKAKATLEPFAAKPDASSRLLETYATILAQSNDPKQAAAMLDRALARGESPDALRMAARLAMTTDPDRAVQLAERGVKARADGAAMQTLGLALLAQSQHRMKRGDTTGGRAAAQQATLAFASVLEQMPMNFDARMSIIDALDVQGKTGETLSHHEALLNMPELPSGVSRAILQNNAAYAIVRAGRTGMELERARGLVDAAIKAQPLAPFYDTLGSVERARKDRAGAIAAYRKAVELDATMASTWTSLAEQLAQGEDGERREAIEIARRWLAQSGALDAPTRTRLEQILPK